MEGELSGEGGGGLWGLGGVMKEEEEEEAASAHGSLEESGKLAERD